MKEKLKEKLKATLPPRLKKTIADNLEVVRVKHRVRQFLSPGIYRVHMHPITKIKAAALHLPILIKLRHPERESISEKNRSVIHRLSVYVAFKTVFLAEERTVSLYHNTEKCRDRMRRIDMYVGQILYPKSEFYEISIDECYTITERVTGSSYYDKRHALYYADEMLKYAVRAERMEKPEKYQYLDSGTFKNIRYHVQHGDMQAYNVLWQDDTHYKTIDFDTIDIYPTFYDFFYVILSEKGQGIEEYLNGCFDQGIADYMAAHGIHESVEKFKDECLAAFIRVPGKYVHDVEIVSRIVPENYTKTQEALAAGAPMGGCFCTGDGVTCRQLAMGQQ